MRATRLCALTTVALLLSALAAPLAATSFELDFESTPTVQNLLLSVDGAAAVELDDEEVAAPGTLPSDRLDPPALRAAAHWSALDAVQADDASARAAGDRGMGSRSWRWLKRYWWVPVLVAGAVVIAADDGSDSPDDVED